MGELGREHRGELGGELGEELGGNLEGSLEGYLKGNIEGIRRGTWRCSNDQTSWWSCFVRIFKCDVCTQNFAFEGLLRKHKKRPRIAQTLKCEVCTHIF